MPKLITRDQMQSYANCAKQAAEDDYNLIGEGFTDLSESKNAKEYSRQYVHERTERSDVVGYSPSISYSFDMYQEDPVCERIAEITDGEFVGNDAHIDVVVVHLFDGAEGAYKAFKRTYAVIPDSKGSGTDALIYTGTLKAVGEAVEGTFNTSTKKFAVKAED